MLALVLIAGALLVLLVWVGRAPGRVTAVPRLWRALIAALAAVAAVVTALRGGWAPPPVRVARSAGLAQPSRPVRGPPGTPGPGGMSLREAREVLGVGEDAGRAEIEA